MEGYKNHLQTQDPNTWLSSHFNHRDVCETWTPTAELEWRIQTFEMRCYRIFGISFRDRITNEDVRNWVRTAIGPHDDLLSIVKTRKLRWYGHVTLATGLANTIMQGTVPGGRRRGRPKKCWHDNIKEWTELPLAKTLRLAEDRDGWRKIIKTSVVPLQPPQQLRAADDADDGLWLLWPGVALAFFKMRAAYAHLTKKCVRAAKICVSVYYRSNYYLGQKHEQQQQIQVRVQTYSLTSHFRRLQRSSNSIRALLIKSMLWSSPGPSIAMRIRLSVCLSVRRDQFAVFTKFW